MENSTVWMISGNKGGVGKSLFSLALASAFSMRGEPFAVFDGDGRTGDVFTIFNRKVPARWGDFRELRPDSHTCMLDGVYEKTLHQLLRGSPHLIVNTPDGADRVLMKWFDTTLRHTESHNRLFKFVFLMSDRPDGLDMLPMLSERFQFLFPVRNLYFGDPKLFTAFNENHAERFNEVIDFPVLRHAEARLLFDQGVHPEAALNQKKEDTDSYLIPTLSRARIRSWQFEVIEAVDNMIENCALPNVALRSELEE